MRLENENTDFVLLAQVTCADNSPVDLYEVPSLIWPRLDKITVIVPLRQCLVADVDCLVPFREKQIKHPMPVMPRVDVHQ